MLKNPEKKPKNPKKSGSAPLRLGSAPLRIASAPLRRASAPVRGPGGNFGTGRNILGPTGDRVALVLVSYKDINFRLTYIYIYICFFVFFGGGGVCVVAFVCDRSALKKNKSKAESKQKQNNIAAEEKMEEKGPRKPRDVLIFSRNFSRLHRYLSDYG